MWHSTAPRLAERFTVVAADLAGYGDSLRPAPAADHAPHSKRALAADQVAAMASWASSASPSPVMTAAVGSPTGWRSTTRAA